MIAVSDRTTIVDALEACFVASNGFHQQARAFRNRLFTMTVIAIVAGTVIVLLQWRIPSVAFISFRNEGSPHVSSWLLILLVMAFGLVGALLTTTASILKLSPVGSPFNFPFQKALLKIVLGPLTATVGVIVVGSGTVTGGWQNLQGLIAGALVFGGSQQAVTRLLDQRAAALVPLGTASQVDGVA